MLFISEKLEQVKVRHFVNTDLQQHKDMVQLYAYLSLAIPKELLGMLPHQYSLIALKPSI